MPFASASLCFEWRGYCASETGGTPDLTQDRADLHSVDLQAWGHNPTAAGWTAAPPRPLGLSACCPIPHNSLLLINLPLVEENTTNSA
ncbi:uncharacterized [Tachysurus ichikawai]